MSQGPVSFGVYFHHKRPTMPILPAFAAAPPTLLIYTASAGSGKTYTLVEHYLTLALGGAATEAGQPTVHDARAFRNILGMTFTNKAAAEMKERVLHALHEVATGPASPGGHRPALMAKLGLPESDIRERAAQTLQAVLHGYGWFALGTIDGFVTRLVRAFAREFDLSDGYELELREELLRQEAVDRLLARVDPKQNPELTQLLVDLCELSRRRRREQHAGAPHHEAGQNPFPRR